jgi:hypothetical protein
VVQEKPTDRRRNMDLFEEFRKKIRPLVSADRDLLRSEKDTMEEKEPVFGSAEGRDEMSIAGWHSAPSR